MQRVAGTATTGGGIEKCQKRILNRIPLPLFSSLPFFLGAEAVVVAVLLHSLPSMEKVVVWPKGATEEECRNNQPIHSVMRKGGGDSLMFKC